jgi:acetyl-CoA carboxylase carboxyltransferase component
MVCGAATMFITAPDVVAAVTGERVSREDLGGAELHSTRTGVATFTAQDETACLSDFRHLLSFLPSNNHEDPPVRRTGDPPDRRCERLLDVVPIEPRHPYDVRDVIEVISTAGSTSRSTPTGPATSSAHSPGWTGTWSASWRTSPASSPAP